MNEDYVSFETAKLLREKGFDEPCRAIYAIDVKKNLEIYKSAVAFSNTDITTKYLEAAVCTCPTLQMAMKWLREVHKLFIQVELYSKHENYWFELFQNTHRLMVEHREVYSTYEEASEAAIKYCLENLI